MNTNISTSNNLICSGNLTISNNILSNGNLQTNNITSSSINNSGSITSNSINGTTANLSNLSISNLLTLLTNNPINFLYNGTQYNISALMLYTLYQLNGVNIASQNYVQTQIANLAGTTPTLLSNLQEIDQAINNDPQFATTITNLIATKSALSSNNIFTGQLNIFNNLLATNIVCNSCSVNSTQLRSSSDIWEASINPTGSYLYFNNAGTIGIYNTINNSFPWYIDINGSSILPTITSSTLNITGSSTFARLPNYVNTSDSLINKNYVDNKFTTLLSANNNFTGSNSFSNNLYSNNLSINNNSTLRSASDLLEISINPTGSYLYFNNAGTLGIYDTVHSSFNWLINLNGLGTFTTLNSTNATISTINSTNATVSTLIAPLVYSNTLMLNCSVNRAPGDIIEAFPTPTSPQYLFFNNSASLGLYNTNTYSSTWFIDINGLGSFPTITSNTANITTANINNSICNYSSITNATITNLSSPNINITDANIRNATISNSVITNSNISSLTLTREILVPNYIRTSAYDVSDSTPRINYLGAGADMTVNLNALGNVSQNCIFEFRITSSPAVTFRTTTTMAYILDLNNNVVTSIYANSKNYFRFHYVYNGTNYVYYQLS